MTSSTSSAQVFRLSHKRPRAGAGVFAPRMIGRLPVYGNTRLFLSSRSHSTQPSRFSHTVKRCSSEIHVGFDQVICRQTVMPEPLLGIRSDDQGRMETIAPEQEEHLPALCAKVHARIAAFLDVQASTDGLRQLQEQTRLSLGIIAEALERYRCGWP